MRGALKGSQPRNTRSCQRIRLRPGVRGLLHGRGGAATAAYASQVGGPATLIRELDRQTAVDTVADHVLNTHFAGLTRDPMLNGAVEDVCRQAIASRNAKLVGLRCTESGEPVEADGIDRGCLNECHGDGDEYYCSSIADYIEEPFVEQTRDWIQ